jgi:hypothetical protein
MMPASGTLDKPESELLSLVLHSGLTRSLPAPSDSSIDLEACKQKDYACVQARTAAQASETKTHSPNGKQDDIASDHPVPHTCALSLGRTESMGSLQAPAGPGGSVAPQLKPGCANAAVDGPVTNMLPGMHAPHGTQRAGRDNNRINDADAETRNIHVPLQQERSDVGKRGTDPAGRYHASAEEGVGTQGKTDGSTARSTLGNKCASVPSTSSSQLRDALHQRMQFLKVAFCQMTYACSS